MQVAKWTWAASVALALVMGSTGCGHGYVPAQESNPVLIATRQEPYLVRAAIVRALSSRHYATEREKPGEIVAKYQHGDLWFRVRIDYGPTQYQVSYLGSDGLDAHTDEDSGKLVVDARYGRWVHGLSRSIDQEIQRPYEEAAEREAARRQYELQVAAEQRRTAEANRDTAAIQSQGAAAPEPSQGDPQPTPSQPVIQVAVPSVDVGGGLNVQRHVQDSQSTQNLHCCINGAFYACPSQQAFEACVGSGPSQCTRTPARDGECR